MTKIIGIYFQKPSKTSKKQAVNFRMVMMLITSGNLMIHYVINNRLFIYFAILFTFIAFFTPLFPYLYERVETPRYERGD